jgi:hypothetical protein
MAIDNRFLSHFGDKVSPQAGCGGHVNEYEKAEVRDLRKNVEPSWGGVNKELNEGDS